MAIIPPDKQWKQPNDGDSLGNVSSTWNIDFKSNRGSVGVSNPLKKVYNDSEIALIDGLAGAISEFDNDVWASHNKMTFVQASGADITDGSLWARDTAAATPDPTSTSDTEVFNNLLLVQEGNNIAAWDGTSWDDNWYGALSGSINLDGTKETFLKTGPDENLYITDDANKVYRLNKDGSTLSTPGAGTLDFSATKYEFTCVTTSSNRIFYGTEDTETEQCVIIEWDMGAQSISANRLHPMGTKRVLSIATDSNDLVVAILSDGSIKYFNGSSFVDYPGANLPESDVLYDNEAIHKNGWTNVDKLLHFLFNPRLDRSEGNLDDSTKSEHQAGIYCLDPQDGFYCRYALTDGANCSQNVSKVGALFARGHKNTKFFASYTLWTDTTTELAELVCEDKTNALASSSWLKLQPLESVEEVIKKITLIHKRLGTGDEMNVYYRRHDEDSIRLAGNWLNSTTFNTTETITGVEKGWVGFTKIGDYFFSTVKNFTDGPPGSRECNVANTNVAANDSGIIELVNYKYMGSVKGGVEMSDLTIPQPVASRQVWIWIELKQAAGNNMQLDYLISD